ncbi:MAG TPA: nuclear transport factor 2 family protein [Ornithinibacter sp.]|nr:nuclear transport factor 2 family protein [Ornithinibacter sp.]
MTSTTAPAHELASVRARNESTWRASAVALYDGDIDAFLSYWSSEPRYSVAYPVDGFPPVVVGHEQFRALFGGLAAAAERIEVTNVRFHQTDDPDVVFVEEHMTADLHGGGHYENDLVIRVTFRDGLIDDMFEYYGQVAHQNLAKTLMAPAEASA